MAPSGAAVAAPIAASARDAEIRITLFYKVQQCNTYVSNRWRHRCTPIGGVETAVAVGVPSRADGSFGAWLRPWRIVLIYL